MMIAVLFGLFQFSLVMKDQGNRYDTNDFISDSPWTEEDVWQAAVLEPGDAVPEGDYVVYIGSSSGDICNTVMQWCTYSKRNLVVCASVTEYEPDAERKPEAILIDGAQMNVSTDTALLEAWEQADVPLIFCSIPEASVIGKNPRLMRLFGIDEVIAEEVDIAGVRVFSGFLLGGETIYQASTPEEEKRMDLELTVPWYHVFGGTKSYIIGMFEETPEDTDMQPALLWRYGTVNNQIFVVCGDYLSDVSGMGYLEAMMTELLPYDIYPVVNAQTFSVVNFPGLSNENQDKIREIYSREQSTLYKDIIWPNLIAVMEESGFVPTCYLTPQFNYQDSGTEPSEEELVFYLKQMKEQNAEAGLSMKLYAGEEELAAKVQADSSFFGQVENHYVYSSLYTDERNLEELKELLPDSLFSGVRTITSEVSGEDMLLSYGSGNVTVQGITHDAFSYRYSDDLRLKGYETALGYSNVLLDLTDVAWPEEEADEWQKRSEVFSANICTYWKPFEDFERTTATESDHRVRNFLALDYNDERDGSCITVSIGNMADSAWFLLRTHGESVERVTGGDYVEVEQDAYLIHAWEEQIQIDLNTVEEHRYTE